VKLLRSPFGYLVAVLVVLAGWIGATVIAAGAWDPVRDAALTPVTEKKADAAGHSLAVYTDIVQPDRAITCLATGPAPKGSKKKAETKIPAAKIDVIAEVDGTEWHLLGLLPEGKDGVDVRCTPRDRKVDNATYSYAIIDGFTSRGRTAQIVLLIGLFGGIAVIGATFWTRRSLRRQAELTRIETDT